MDVWCSVLDTTDNCRVGSHWANCSLLNKNKKQKERVLKEAAARLTPRPSQFTLPIPCLIDQGMRPGNEARASLPLKMEPKYL